MAVFDLDENTGAWFDYPGGGRVRLRMVDSLEWREIVKKTVKKGPPEYPKLDGKHERFQPEETDTDLQMELIWDKTIVEWEGFNDKHDKPIPCEREWKVRLMLMKSDNFRAFYNEHMKAMADAEADQVAESEKN
jgi:hypothetical protein